MPYVSVATNLWDQIEAVEFGEALNDEDAWRFLVRLWAWGIDTDNEAGRFKLTPTRLAAICGYRGKSQALLDAMLQTGWLRIVDGGQYEMRGWDITKRFFGEKRRLKKVTENRRKAREHDNSDSADDTRAARVLHAIDTQDARAVHGADTRGARVYPSPHPYPYQTERDLGPPLSLAEVEQRCFERCGQLGGADVARMSRLQPLYAEEVDIALRTPGKSWKYLAKVIESTREERAKPPPPDYSPPTQALTKQDRNFAAMNAAMEAFNAGRE